MEVKIRQFPPIFQSQTSEKLIDRLVDRLIDKKRQTEKYLLQVTRVKLNSQHNGSPLTLIYVFVYLCAVTLKLRLQLNKQRKQHNNTNFDPLLSKALEPES